MVDNKRAVTIFWHVADIIILPNFKKIGSGVTDP